jgi:cation:H+ antiporter
VESGLIIDYIVMMFTSALPWFLMRKSYTVTRSGGGVLLFCYLIYLVYLIIKA